MEHVYHDSNTQCSTSVEKLLPPDVERLSIEIHLSEDENENPLHNNAKHSWWKRNTAKFTPYLRMLKHLKDIIIIALALWGLYNTILQILPLHQQHQHAHQHIHTNSQPPNQTTTTKLRSCNCGSSISEALTKNCTFDPPSAAWLPPHCIDAPLSHNFSLEGDGPTGDWLYYSDKNHTQQISASEVALLADFPDKQFHMSWKWHVKHCVLYWKKQWRRERGSGVVVEAVYDGWSHIEHCEQIFLEAGTKNTVSGVALNSDFPEE